MRTREQYQAEANGLSTEEVAVRIGMSKAHVLDLIRDGDLRAVDCSRASSGTPHWKVFEDDLATFLRARENRPKDQAA